tara:strand:- start:551 stop:664 length:114 start_codon:yes stop_codon:yes gene_type:complete
LEVVAGVEPVTLVQTVVELMVVLAVALADGFKLLAWY